MGPLFLKVFLSSEITTNGFTNLCVNTPGLPASLFVDPVSFSDITWICHFFSLCHTGCFTFEDLRLDSTSFLEACKWSNFHELHTLPLTTFSDMHIQFRSETKWNRSWFCHKRCSSRPETYEMQSIMLPSMYILHHSVSRTTISYE